MLHKRSRVTLPVHAAGKQRDMQRVTCKMAPLSWADVDRWSLGVRWGGGGGGGGAVKWWHGAEAAHIPQEFTHHSVLEQKLPDKSHHSECPMWSLIIVYFSKSATVHWSCAFSPKDKWVLCDSVMKSFGIVGLNLLFMCSFWEIKFYISHCSAFLWSCLLKRINSAGVAHYGAGVARLWVRNKKKLILDICTFIL